jgi:glycosyltransferase involved in cell wall biosynthesis
MVRAPPEVSVVICTHRRPHLLPASVESVLAQRVAAPFEVIVVNDDDEPLRCRLPDDERLRLIQPERRGLCEGRNAGIRAAAAPIVAFTDDDTLAPPDWLAAVLGAFAAHPEALGVEGPIDYGREVDVLYEHVPLTTVPGGFCACNIAYRRDALFAAGLFDEQFRLSGAEDIDLGLRVAALGPVVGEPTMVMAHPPRPMNVVERIMLARKVENDWLLHAKHHELSGKPRPSRWGPVAWRARDQLRMLRDPDVIAGSPARAARVVVIGVGTVAVGLATACTRPLPREPR